MPMLCGIGSTELIVRELLCAGMFREVTVGVIVARGFLMRSGYRGKEAPAFRRLPVEPELRVEEVETLVEVKALHSVARP